MTPRHLTTLPENGQPLVIKSGIVVPAGVIDTCVCLPG